MIDEEVTIKTVYFKNNILILAASNLKYEDRYFDQEEIERRNIQDVYKRQFLSSYPFLFSSTWSTNIADVASVALIFTETSNISLIIHETKI